MSVLVVKSVCTVFIFFCLHRVDSHGLRALSPKDVIETMPNASHSFLVLGRRMQQLNVTAPSSVGSNFTSPPFGVGSNVSFMSTKSYQGKLSDSAETRSCRLPSILPRIILQLEHCPQTTLRFDQNPQVYYY